MLVVLDGVSVSVPPIAAAFCSMAARPGRRVGAARVIRRLGSRRQDFLPLGVGHGLGFDQGFLWRRRPGHVRVASLEKVLEFLLVGYPPGLLLAPNELQPLRSRPVPGVDGSCPGAYVFGPGAV